MRNEGTNTEHQKKGHDEAYVCADWARFPFNSDVPTRIQKPNRLNSRKHHAHGQAVYNIHKHIVTDLYLPDRSQVSS